MIDNDISMILDLTKIDEGRGKRKKRADGRRGKQEANEDNGESTSIKKRERKRKRAIDIDHKDDSQNDETYHGSPPGKRKA